VISTLKFLNFAKTRSPKPLPTAARRRPALLAVLVNCGPKQHIHQADETIWTKTWRYDMVGSSTEHYYNPATATVLLRRQQNRFGAHKRYQNENKAVTASEADHKLGYSDG
jgi:hypothetical protein